jgi:chemotaxis family two-component system response regulator Rcp1
VPKEKRSIQVLLIEDNSADAFLAQHTIRAYDAAECSVRTMNRAQDAIDFLRSKAGGEHSLMPDLILLDYIMPMGGSETLSAIRAIPEARHIPVLVLTGTSSEDHVCDAYRRGANITYRKPSDLQGYEVLMRQLLDHWLGIARLPMCPPD